MATVPPGVDRRHSGGSSSRPTARRHHPQTRIRVASCGPSETRRGLGSIRAGVAAALWTVVKQSSGASHKSLGCARTEYMLGPAECRPPLSSTKNCRDAPLAARERTWPGLPVPHTAEAWPMSRHWFVSCSAFRRRRRREGRRVPGGAPAARGRSVSWWVPTSPPTLSLRVRRRRTTWGCWRRCTWWSACRRGRPARSPGRSAGPRCWSKVLVLDTGLAADLCGAGEAESGRGRTPVGGSAVRDVRPDRGAQAGRVVRAFGRPRAFPGPAGRQDRPHRRGPPDGGVRGCRGEADIDVHSA